MHHFTFPPAELEGSNISLSSPIPLNFHIDLSGHLCLPPPQTSHHLWVWQRSALPSALITGVRAGVTCAVSGRKHCCLFPQCGVPVSFPVRTTMCKREARQTDPETTPFLDLWRRLGLVRVSKRTPDDTKPAKLKVCRQTRDTWKALLVRAKRVANVPKFLRFALISTKAVVPYVKHTLLLSL